jgi:hypothetical protein
VAYFIWKTHMVAGSGLLLMNYYNHFQNIYANEAILKLILQKYVLIDPDFFLSSGRFTEGMLF